MEKTDKTDFNARITAIDIIRLVAISFVVWVHCQEQMNFDGLLSSLTYLLGRTGVPLFLMITGTLILSKNINIKNFLAKKILHIYIISVFWFYIYGSFDLSFSNNIYCSLMLIPTAKHLWYLSMLPFLYSIIFFLSGINKISTKNLLLLVFGCFLYKWISIFLHFGFILDNYFIYIAYVIFGYTVYNRELYKKIPLSYTSLSVLATIIMFLLIHPQSMYDKLFNGYDKWWYYSPFIVLFSGQMYILLLSLSTRIHLHTYTQLLSKSCFGVYVIHLLILNNIKLNNVFLLFITTVIISFVVTILLSRLPVIKFLFYKNLISL